ncbi:hypothetical protein GOP47_0028812 [Adiantum capillus-veneris]|nr:hypothetical protein GOP47_0028812 [Adiantum capillus-veneris]
MAIIRCLAVVSTVGMALVIILSTQLTTSGNNIYLGVVIALSIVCCLSLILLLFKLLQRQRRARCQLVAMKGDEKGIRPFSELDTEEEDDYLKALNSSVPTKLNFKELEIATQGFCKLLGQGGFGCVYEGDLPNGTKIAVKRLETESKMRSKEFCAEVVTISGIHHINLVRLLGFCAEGNHRLLVYEYMQNGSLDRWLFRKRKTEPCAKDQSDSDKPTEKDVEEKSLEKKSSTEKNIQNCLEKDDSVKKETNEKGALLLTKTDGEPRLSWMVRFRIALQTARALAYLHEECRETILHLDVKPQNILLDSQFDSKVSDFGLSRAINRDQSRIVTSMRGTPGYLAPEWLINAGITHKSDVYSYGMVLLELVSGRRNVDHSQDSEAWYFPAVAFKCAQEGRMEDIIDPGLRESGMTLDEMDEAFLAIRVAFWCIQDQVAARPAMTSVVRMLEGSMPVGDPPLTGAFSFNNVLVQNGGEGLEGMGVVPVLKQPGQKTSQHQENQLNLQNATHPHPSLQTEEPFSISFDSSTPDSPLPTPPGR